MGEVEIQTSQTTGDKNVQANLDVNEIIGKVREFISSVKGISQEGEPMAVNVDSFNFTFGKAEEEYNLDFKVTLTIKPKEQTKKAP